MDIVNNCRQYFLMLDCLVFSGLIVLVGLRKSSLHVTIFFAKKIQLQFDSLHLVRLLFCLFSVFFSCVSATTYGD